MAVASRRKCLKLLLLSYFCQSVCSFQTTNGKRPRSYRSASSLTGSKDDSALPVPFENDQKVCNDNDKFFLRGWPLGLQHGLRDSGALRIIVDTATRVLLAPSFYYENPLCLPEFIRISGYPRWITAALRTLKILDNDKEDVDFSAQAYGSHRKQVIHIMANRKHKDCNDLPIFMFLHGGAWGSGFPTMYRLLSVPFLKENYRTAIVGYRTYPDANIEGQVEDVAEAVHYLRERYPGNRPIVLMAHSSGAHVALTAALNGRITANQIDAIIGMSGVYDLETHYEYEKKRGLEQISPMAAANGFSTDNLRRNSPVLLAQQRHAENEQAGTSYNFPPTLLLHGASDDMALPSCSLKLQNALTAAASENNSQNSKSSCQVQVLDGVGHQDTVLQTLLGGKTQTAVFQWIQSELGI